MKRLFPFIVSLCLVTFARANPSASADLDRYLLRRESCEHWLGEQGYDLQRQADINWSVCHSCSGIDEQLKKLKQKYRTNPNVLAQLKNLDPQLASPNQAESKRACAKTIKPSWLE